MTKVLCKMIGIMADGKKVTVQDNSEIILQGIARSTGLISYTIWKVQNKE